MSVEPIWRGIRADTRDEALADMIRSAVVSLQVGEHEPAVRHAVVLMDDIEICVYRRD